MWRRLLSSFRKRLGVVEDSASIAEGEARRVELGDATAGGALVVLCRVGGELFALDARCPHGEGGALVGGPLIDERYAVCPLHHYVFDPRTGSERNGFCRNATRYRVIEEDGRAEVYP